MRIDNSNNLQNNAIKNEDHRPASTPEKIAAPVENKTEKPLPIQDGTARKSEAGLAANNIAEKLKQAVEHQKGISKLFGTAAFPRELNISKDPKKPAGPLSLGALLAQVGSSLVKATDSTTKKLIDAAMKLDALTTSNSATGVENQKIQELTINLQQIQQSLNRINDVVTNLSRSQSDALKSEAQNLSV